jgi:hypothetical protein
MDLNKSIICPKCGSKNIYIDKKGFSTGKAIAGGLLTGNIFVAAAAGGIGANKIVLTCLDCGHKFNIGEGGHDINKSYPTQAEIKEFERHVIPKEEMPEVCYYKCDCGKWFSAEKNGYCPSCGRKMSDRNIPTVDEIKEHGKSGGCLGLILAPIIFFISMYWIL